MGVVFRPGLVFGLGARKLFRVGEIEENRRIEKNTSREVWARRLDARATTTKTIGSSWGHLGRRGALLDRLGAVLDLSWAVSGASWAVLGASWAVLGLSWAVLGPYWRPSWGGLGGPFGRLGASESRIGEKANFFQKPL